MMMLLSRFRSVYTTWPCAAWNLRTYARRMLQAIGHTMSIQVDRYLYLCTPVYVRKHGPLPIEYHKLGSGILQMSRRMRVPRGNPQCSAGNRVPGDTNLVPTTFVHNFLPYVPHVVDQAPLDKLCRGGPDPNVHGRVTRWSRTGGVPGEA